MRSILRILFWTYDRGSWQYDILCGFILAFIFLTPKGVFDGSALSREQDVLKNEKEATTFLDL